MTSKRMPNLETQFIAHVPLPKTASRYPDIDLLELESGEPIPLFCRMAWFPRAAGTERRNIYCLFVGTAEAIEKHGPAIADVTAMGNDVLVFEFPGQGGSGRFLRDVRKVHACPGGFDLWTDCLKEALRTPLFRAVRQRAFDARVSCVALPYSLGGHFFARLIQEQPAFARRFTHVVYVNPVVAMNSAGSMALRVVQSASVWLQLRRSGYFGKADHFLPGHGRFHPGDRPLAKSSIGTDTDRHDWLCQFYHERPDRAMWGMTFGWFDEANRSLIKMWRRLIKDEARHTTVKLWCRARRRPISQRNATGVPTLVISSERDTIVIAHYVKRFAKFIGADVLHLPTAKHEPSQEPPAIREGTYGAVAAWVDDPFAPDLAAMEPDVQFKPAACKKLASDVR